MTIKIAELHHFAVRIAPGPDAAGAALRFYNDILGLESDHVPWDRPGEGQRIKAGSYVLEPGITPQRLLDKLARGEESLRAVTLVATDRPSSTGC